MPRGTGVSRFRLGWSAQRYQGRRLRWDGVEISLRVDFEFFGAAGAAKVIILPRVLVRVLGRGGVHVHPADGIAFEDGRGIGGGHAI